QLTSLQEDVAHLGVHDQVYVSLPIPQLDICQPMPLLREGKQIFRKKCQFINMDRQLPRSCTKQIASDSDVIAKIQQSVKLEPFVANRVLLHVNLQTFAVLLQMGKSRF